MSLYLIKRGEERFNTMPAPVILTDNGKVANFRTGDSSHRNWVWVRNSKQDDGEGWLLRRWNGLDIDYGYVVKMITMPDGTVAAFCHRGTEPWNLLRQAVWWSDNKMPVWLALEGVRYRMEEQQKIEDDFRFAREIR